jgi:hypothetical protein
MGEQFTDAELAIIAEVFANRADHLAASAPAYLSSAAMHEFLKREDLAAASREAAARTEAEAAQCARVSGKAARMRGAA